MKKHNWSLTRYNYSYASILYDFNIVFFSVLGNNGAFLAKSCRYFFFRFQGKRMQP